MSLNLAMQESSNNSLEKLQPRSTLIVGAGIFSLLLLLFVSTSPSSIGPYGILGIVFLLYMLLVSIFTWINLKRYSGAEKSTVLTKSAIEALVPGAFIALSSIHQLGILDIVFVCLLFLVGRFYIKRKMNIL